MKIKLPYPSKILGVTFTKGRTIGFEFTNLAMFQFYENNKVKDSNQLNVWVEVNGHAAMLNEVIFGAAQAYCMINKTEENFTRDGLLKAIALSNDEDKQRIIDACNESLNVVAKGKGEKKKTK